MELLKTKELRRHVTYNAYFNENMSCYKNLEITLSGKLMLHSSVLTDYFPKKSLNKKETSGRDQLKKSKSVK